MGLFKNDIEGIRKAKEQQFTEQDVKQQKDDEKLASIGERAKNGGLYNQSITEDERSWLFKEYPSKWDEFSRGSIK